MPVSPTSRRIFRYWLLLLVPTLLVGAAAIALLWREQGRVDEQSAEARAARLAAITAQSRLIAENVELLAGDVESALLEAVATAPVEGIESFLTEWEATNPLVRTAFRATLNGRLIRPQADGSAEDARGFVRRFPRFVGSRPPWLEEAPPEAPAKVFDYKMQKEEAEARQQVDLNVAQARSNRYRLQQELRIANYPAPPAPTTQAPTLADAAAGAGQSIRRGQAAESDQRAAGVSGERRAAAAADTAASAVAGPVAPVAVQMAQAKDAAVPSRGWLAPVIDGRQHVIGWARAAETDEIRGVELETIALVSRLGGALSAAIGPGEGYALRDEQGRVMHQVGAVPRTGEPVSRLPLATALLPGWEVAAFFAAPYDPTARGGFLWAGVLLVTLFVAAIVAAGSLLMWQARRSEDEAAQKTSFVANVSHEFKTPLTTIRLYSELLEQGRVRDAEQGTDYLRTIGRETQRLARLVNNALDFSRLEQGRKKYAREITDLTAELGRLLDTHAPRVAEAGMELKRDLPPERLERVTDRDALEQIVLNLIDNACKYAAAGGEVLVSLRPRAGGGIEVRVADRGPGVPGAHRERIFEKFHRVDDALTAEKTGAGLGLSIARQLARGLGGELSFEPREGGGAEFVLILP